VRRDLGSRQRHGLDAAGLAERRVPDATGPAVDRHPAAEVREVEGRLTVAAVRRPDEGEERVVLGDGHRLSLAERPAVGSEGAREDPDLADEGVRHGW
jgi:hypothetical protein